MVHIILERKNAFLEYKNKKLKESKYWDFFLKGLVHGFGQKLAIFPTSYCKRMCFNILERKNACLDYKNRKLKKVEKFGFFKRG